MQTAVNFKLKLSLGKDKRERTYLAHSVLGLYRHRLRQKMLIGEEISALNSCFIINIMTTLKENKLGNAY